VRRRPEVGGHPDRQASPAGRRDRWPVGSVRAAAGRLRLGR
jgi:hypothetical protein